MSILINEAYANKKTQLWRSAGTTTPAPVSTAFLGSGLNIGSGSSFHISGLTAGQRYTFSIDAGLECVQTSGVPTLATMNDGTNGVVLQVSASSSVSATGLPPEVAPNPAGASYITANFPGALRFEPTWSYIFASASHNYATISFDVQFDLTPTGTDLWFFLENVNTSPSVANSLKSILTAVIVYTQPIV